MRLKGWGQYGKERWIVVRELKRGARPLFFVYDDCFRMRIAFGLVRLLLHVLRSIPTRKKTWLSGNPRLSIPDFHRQSFQDLVSCSYQTCATVNCMPRTLRILMNVVIPGLPSSDNALRKPCRVMPASLAILVNPFSSVSIKSTGSYHMFWFFSSTSQRFIAYRS